MMKSINISTKIAILILAISLVTVAAISFFSYDYHLKSNRDKFTTNLTVIADNRALYFNTYFEKNANALELLQQDEKLRPASGAAASDGGFDMMAMMGGGPPSDAGSDVDTIITTSSNSSLTDYLIEQKDILGVADIILTSSSGNVVASTDSNVKGSFAYPDLETFTNAQKGIYFSAILRDKKTKRYYSYVAGAVNDT